jgi:hypothetical protein
VSDTKGHRRRTPAHTDAGRVDGTRRTALWGLAFVLLLLVSAGMVTVPGGDDSVTVVRRFYDDHRAVIVVAQVIGLLAAAVFVPFAQRLQRSRSVGGAPWVFATGCAVAGAAVLTAVPPLLLCAVATSAGRATVADLATASDLTDVVLFAAIAAFGAAVVRGVTTTWLRAVAGAVALLCAVRAVLLLAGSAVLEVVAPVAFVVLVLCVAGYAWRSRAA